MADLPRISIIVPVYKSASFLQTCINSIRSQTYTNWELLLIDDGSPDDSGRICDDFATQDSRIRVFHQENAGVSNARNVGIKYATGDFLCFIDSDDFVEPDYLESFGCFSTSPDLYLQGYKIREQGRVDQIISFESLYKLGKTDFASVYIYAEKEHILNSPCFRLFKRKIVIDYHILFDCQLSFGEDHLFSLGFLLYAKSIVYSSASNYIYMKRSGGSLTSGYVDHRQFVYYADRAFQYRLQILSVRGIEDEHFVRFIEAERSIYILRAIFSLYECSENKEERRRCLLQYIGRLDKRLEYRSLPSLYRVPYFMYKYLPKNIVPTSLSLFYKTDKIRKYLKSLY